MSYFSDLATALRNCGLFRYQTLRSVLADPSSVIGRICMDLILDLIVTVVSLSVIVQYSWSLKAHFNSPKMPTGTVVISVVVLTTAAIFVALLWIESQPALATLVGLVLEGLALWLFWAAIKASRAARLKMAFDVQNPHGLVTTGPYRYLRHPFYTSYLIFWVGWVIATWSPWSLPPLAV